MVFSSWFKEIVLASIILLEIESVRGLVVDDGKMMDG